MTLAGQHLAEFARWLDRSSASKLSPCAVRRRDAPSGWHGLRYIPKAPARSDDFLPRGRYAELLPCDFDQLPSDDFDDQALPLFVSFEQCSGVTLPEVAQLGAPAGQPRAVFRLAHLIHRLQDARDATKAGHWRFKGDTFAAMALLGLDDPLEPISGAVTRAGADRLDRDAFPVIAAPLWRLPRKERAMLQSTTGFPFLPV